MKLQLKFTLSESGHGPTSQRLHRGSPLNGSKASLMEFKLAEEAEIRLNEDGTINKVEVHKVNKVLVNDPKREAEIINIVEICVKERRGSGRFRRILYMRFLSDYPIIMFPEVAVCGESARGVNSFGTTSWNTCLFSNNTLAHDTK
ncbi:unnamed protein product [Nesidiocoris tenuis]|uniref:Uncharacterized protein n=1 Tax=Nesidiocoris tenuis TaxID=355587 RepID=A0A6H5FZX7_9HEMI|nr:unnamed protein product [Nesidiocoris tenuis]CAA9995017.1 unnamed protein product [Nesidiocoris tenuis]